MSLWEPALDFRISYHDVTSLGKRYDYHTRSRSRWGPPVSVNLLYPFLRSGLACPFLRSGLAFGEEVTRNTYVRRTESNHSEMVYVKNKSGRRAYA